MSHDRLRLPHYLGHILQAIDRINRYTTDLDEEAFFKSEIAQDAVIRNFEVIGEASHNIERIDPSFIASHPELP